MLDHTFVVCAYQESPYLRECIRSLKGQTATSKIVIATSTPNDYIEKIAEEEKISVYVNTGESGITQDWNFGLKQVQTTYATIAHQDDIYEPEYTESIFAAIKKCRKPLLIFSGYGELRGKERVTDNAILNIKKTMLLPLKVKGFWKNRFVRRRILSLGDPICCPAVTFSLENLQQPIFQHGFRSCEDWEAWEKISKIKGEFAYIPKPLMYHRIHDGSATTAILKDHARVEENYIMYCKFWPKWIARGINHFYTKSEQSNEMEKRKEK